MYAIGQGLIDRGLSAERPVAILSGNDLEHALLALAAMHVGVPYAPISPAYSVISTDHAKLRFILQLLTPGLVFAAHGERYGTAIAAAVAPEAELVVTEAPATGRATTMFESLLAGSATAAVEQAHAATGPDTIAKILFTSGSTGQPKGVINTQRMLCSNQAMIAATMPYLKEVPPVIVDWLPWNHTFGGNHNIGLVLHNGGTLYIDDGKPLPGQFERTVRNLREIAPTVYFNVPRGFEELVPYLKREPALREKFFSRVGMLFYAGAGLSQPVWDAFDELAVQTCGERILWITGLGLDGDRTVRHLRQLGSGSLRDDRTAGGGAGYEACARRRQTRGTVSRTQRQSGLLAAARTHARGVRRRRLLPDGRRGALCRPGPSRKRLDVRRPAR